jgi:hypothetical protein
MFTVEIVGGRVGGARAALVRSWCGADRARRRGGGGRPGEAVVVIGAKRGPGRWRCGWRGPGDGGGQGRVWAWVAQ